MVDIEKVDLKSEQQINDFVQFQYDLYKDVAQFCPPFVNDIKLMMNKAKHPFYERSDAEFFVAKQNGKIVARIAIMVNKPFNEYHKTKKAQFYLFECINDQEVANKLFEKAFEWCRQNGLDEVVGPKGFAAFDGYGILVEGFEHRQMMTMMNYNFDYYPKLLESIGFEKEVDFVSCYVHADKFNIPDKVKEISRRVRERGNFKVLSFKNKQQMMRDWADKIGRAYNDTFVNNWEYYPLSEGEVKLLVDNLMVVADPKLIKIITYNDKIVGFLLAFPDISAALQRHHGKITPWGILDMLWELKKSKWVSINGAGVLPEYQGRGGMALLYDEMEKTVKDYGFIHGEMTQVAETAVQMRKDLLNLGGQPYKNHRVYHKKIA
jgi:GNAT superfamily N-acetyltransferase